MRILHFISSPAAGGAELYVRDLAISMQEEGHDVHIVFLQTAAESCRDLRFEKEFIETLTAEGISYSFIGKAARKRPWLGVFRLRKTVKSFNPDLVHCHLYYALLFSFFLFGVPVVYTHHNIKLGLPKFLYHLFDYKVSFYVAICNACKKSISGGLRPVVKINNGVSKKRMRLSNMVGSYSFSGITFVFVGSLCEQKNLDLMFEAFRAFRHKDVRLLIVGEGPYRERLENLAASLEIDQRVEFLGNITDVCGVLAQSDVFLMSSAWEGLPIALIEATLAGLPVVVTNVGGCAEVVHQCANGFVVDSFDSSDYIMALRKMVDDEPLRASFARNAQAFSSEFEIETSVEKHLNLYQTIITLGSGGQSAPKIDSSGK